MYTKFVSRYLIVRADGDVRVTRMRPQLRWNEVAFPLEIRIPDVWGRVQNAELKVEMPEPKVDLTLQPDPIAVGEAVAE